MLSVEVGDVGWCSKDGRSKTRKSMGKLPPSPPKGKKSRLSLDPSLSPNDGRSEPRQTFLLECPPNSKKRRDDRCCSKDGRSKGWKGGIIMGIEEPSESRPTAIKEKTLKIKLPRWISTSGKSRSLEPSNISYWSDGRCCRKRMVECAEIALSSFNEKSLSKQGPEYELVEALECIQLTWNCIHHCNFIARLKNETEAEKMLFFAEVKYGNHFTKVRKNGLGCYYCCILGPIGSVTGLFGCKICEINPGLIQHPEDGFTKD